MKNLKLKFLVLLVFCPFQFLQANNYQKNSSRNSNFVQGSTFQIDSLTLVFSVVSAPCSGSNIDLTVEGGTSPYSYTWSNGETIEDLFSVNPGLYSVTVMDSLGLIRSGQVIVDGDSVFVLNTFVNDVTCPRARDGSANVIASGGIAPYTYLWSNGITVSEITRSNGGNFSVIVTDAQGCSKTAQVTISSPARFGFNVQQQDASCAGGNDGFINVIATGGSAPYTYLWSTGDTVPALYNLFAGTYELTLTDRRNCNVTIDATIFSPDSISVEASTSINCAGGNIDLNVSGGTPPYSFQWSSGDTTEDLQGLIAGVYTVQVLDSRACRMNPLSVQVFNFPPIIYEADKKDVSCFGMNDGSISIHLLSGTAPFNFAWSNGDTSDHISGLVPGIYSVSISDANGCNNSTSRLIDEPSVLETTVSVSGSEVDLNVSGGTAPYSYLWSNGATTEDLFGVSNGIYTVEVKDEGNCIANASAEVSVIPPVLNASIDCCMDTYINQGETYDIPVNFNMPGPYVLKYKEIYDRKTSAIKTVNTSSNPYFINASLTSTTTYELVSVSQDNVYGTVCGRATIGVNDVAGNCAASCFSAEMLSVESDGICNTFTVRVLNDGSCRHALSHLSVSVPCGNIQSVSNDRNFPIEYGMDPKTEIKGFKIDNISDFGEKKDGTVESFMLTYTICSVNESCMVPTCAPLVSFKAGQCIFYAKPFTGLAGRVAQHENDAVENSGDVIIYPNPSEGGQSLNIVLPSSIVESTIFVNITDHYGKEQYSCEYKNEEASREILITTIPALAPGLYLVTIKSGKHQYKNKLIVR